MQRHECETKLRRYLLGQLGPIEQARVEEQYFHDDECFAQLLEAEDQLIEDYLQNRLSVSEKLRFDTYYLDTLRKKQRLKLSIALNCNLARHEKHWS